MFQFWETLKHVKWSFSVYKITASFTGMIRRKTLFIKTNSHSNLNKVLFYGWLLFATPVGHLWSRCLLNLDGVCQTFFQLDHWKMTKTYTTKTILQKVFCEANYTSTGVRKCASSIFGQLFISYTLPLAWHCLNHIS